MPRLSEDDKVARLSEDIAAAEEVAELESQENGRLYERYRAKKMGNEIAGRSQIVSSDIFETIEWALPALMDIFDVNNGIPEFEPQGPEDEDAASKMTQLVRYQFWRLNDGETILRQAIKDALMYRPGGVIKFCWEKEVLNEPKSYEGLTGEELAYLASRKDVSITGVTEVESGYCNVEAEMKVTQYDGPRIYLVPPWEFLRHPNTRNIKESPFVAHKKKVTVDYLRRMGKAGHYKNVERAIEEANGPPTTDYTEEKIYAQDGLTREAEKSKDESRAEVWLYECYVKMDVDGDGLLENRMMSMVGKTILRDVENVYGYPPFVCLRAVEDTHKFSGITLAEMIEDLQKLNTFMLRQTVDNLAQSNNTRKVYDPTRINQADLMLNVPGAPIRTTQRGVDVRSAIMELPTVPIHPTTLQFFGISKEMGEQRTGISKSFRGVGDNTNETASGQFQAINQASLRIRLIAKIIGSELANLFRAFVVMNKKFQTQEVVVRLEGQPLEIAPDDLEGKMDLVLNIFLGAATRQQTVMNMQQSIAIFGQLMQGTGLPVLDASNIKAHMIEIYRAMGIKAPERFLPVILRVRPEAAEQLMQIERMKNQLMMGGGGGGGGDTLGSSASTGGGGSATTNPGGAGIQSGAIQPGAGSMGEGMAGLAY